MYTRSFVVRTSIVLCMLACISLSLPLWQAKHSYPRVPLIDLIPPFPQPIDALLLLFFGVPLLTLVWWPRFRLAAIVMFSSSLILVLQDQSRLQPWFIANALFLAALVFSGSEEEALDSCRLIVVSIYFWSGVHKMNTSFVNALFPSLVSSFATPRLAMPIHILGSIVPYLEMGMGLALLFPRTRRAGVVAIVGMHMSLLAVLGPWVLGWNSVVWPWNFTLMLLAPVLFWQSQVSGRELLRPGRNVARWFLFVVLLALPSLSLAELSDTSLSFDLYSGDPLIGSVVLSPDAWRRLDAGPRAVAEHFGDGYIVRFSDWSLAALNVPAYPAERVLRRVAQSFCSVHQKDNDVIFLMEKPARWFYRSGWHKIEGAQELCSGATLQSRGLMPPIAE